MDRLPGTHLNLAFQNLDELSDDFILKFAADTNVIDLSNNKFRELHSLRDFKYLHTLILDGNKLTSFSAFPFSEKIHHLSVNNNEIDNLTVFVSRLCEDLPKLKFLSMMKNEAAPSYFNGGTKQQNEDYRYYVISHFRYIENLDGAPVSEEERSAAYQVYGRRWKRKKRHSSAYY